MGLPILNHLLPQGILVELNAQPTFKIFPCVPLVLGMVASRLALYPILTRSLMDMFYRCQVFHKTTPKMYVIILAINYVVSFLNVDTYFP